MTDGQLSDCPLTIDDLTRIEEAFTRVLTMGVYHSRIEYPASNLKENYTTLSGTDPKDSNGDRNIHKAQSLAERAS